jgi:hypothetical protein
MHLYFIGRGILWARISLKFLLLICEFNSHKVSCFWSVVLQFVPWSVMHNSVSPSLSWSFSSTTSSSAAWSGLRVFCLCIFLYLTVFCWRFWGVVLASQLLGYLCKVSCCSLLRWNKYPLMKLVCLVQGSSSCFRWHIVGSKRWCSFLSMVICHMW